MLIMDESKMDENENAAEQARALKSQESAVVVPRTVVLQQMGAVSQEAVTDLERLTPTQQAGLWLAAGVGLTIIGVLVFTAVVWFQTAPRPPTLLPLPAVTDPAKAKDVLASYQAVNQAALDNYKALNAEAISRVTSLFDLLATKTLLPIFTAILGYIFGSRAAAAANSRNSD